MMGVFILIMSMGQLRLCGDVFLVFLFLIIVKKYIKYNIIKYNFSLLYFICAVGTEYERSYFTYRTYGTNYMYQMTVISI